jgi:hypothetical protein
MNACEIEIGRPESTNQYGNDNNGWLCTAIVVPQYREYLSENSVSYWCSVNCYGIDLKIGKQSHYGLKITKAIQDKASPGQIKHLLLAAALEHMKPVQFVDVLNQVRRDAIEEGRNEIRQGMLNLLFPNGI